MHTFAAASRRSGAGNRHGFNDYLAGLRNDGPPSPREVGDCSADRASGDRRADPPPPVPQAGLGPPVAASVAPLCADSTPWQRPLTPALERAVGPCSL